jgi:hypothetical protein
MATLLEVNRINQVENKSIQAQKKIQNFRFKLIQIFQIAQH